MTWNFCTVLCYFWTHTQPHPPTSDILPKTHPPQNLTELCPIFLVLTISLPGTTLSFWQPYYRTSSNVKFLYCFRTITAWLATRPSPASTLALVFVQRTLLWRLPASLTDSPTCPTSTACFSSKWRWRCERKEPPPGFRTGTGLEPSVRFLLLWPNRETTLSSGTELFSPL